MDIPKHYDQPITPWDLQRHMQSTGNLFADARRTDAIEYAFRIKDDPIADLRKAAHCLLAAVEELEKMQGHDWTLDRDYQKHVHKIAETCDAEDRPCDSCLAGGICDGPDIDFSVVGGTNEDEE